REGAEVLRLVHDGAPHIDLLATDVVMPSMSGRDLADRLRQERAGLKVLFISGYTDDTLLRHGVYEARESFLQKPFALQAFAAKEREILDQKKPARVFGGVNIRTFTEERRCGNGIGTVRKNRRHHRRQQGHWSRDRAW